MVEKGVDDVLSGKPVSRHEGREQIHQQHRQQGSYKYPYVEQHGRGGHTDRVAQLRRHVGNVIKDAAWNKPLARKVNEQVRQHQTNRSAQKK